MSAHSWGRLPGSVDPRCRCPSEQQSVVVAGVRRTRVGADLQLVPSHPLLSHPDSLPGAAQHLTPRTRRPVVENPLRDQASRRRQGWRLGRHCSRTSLLHSAQQGPLIFQRKTASLFRPLPAAVLEVGSPTACRSCGMSLEPQGH